MKKLIMFLALSLLIGSGYAQNLNKSEGTSTPLFYATATQIWQTTLEDIISAGTQLTTPTLSGINSMELVNGMLYISRGISMSTGVFEKYDLNTESPTQIPISTGSLFQSLAWNPVSNTMYATTASPFQFGTVNLTTGDFTRISDLDRASRIAIDNDGIGFLQEASTGARFGTINLETGEFTHIADAQITMALIDLAVDRRTNVLYSQALSTVNTDVAFTTINKETGARTSAGSTSVRYRTFVFGFIEPTTVKYTVTITPGVNGTITVMDGTDEVESGDDVEENTVLTLTAEPAQGFEFEQWWDGNTDATRVITLISDTTISATFTESAPVETTPLFWSNGSQIRRTTLEDFSEQGEQISSTSNVHGIEFVNGVLYASRGTGAASAQFGTFDLTTGDFEEISTGVLFHSFAWNPVNNTMYATTSMSQFGTVNLTTGAFTQIGENLLRHSRIAIDNNGIGFLQEIGPAFGTPVGRIGTINLETGVFTPLQNANITAVNVDLAVDRRTNTLYSQALTGTGFVTIDKETGARTNIGNTFVRYRTFAFDSEMGAPIEPTTYTVTIATPINGTITVMDGTDEVESGDEVDENTVLTLTAEPAQGFKFEAWMDGNTELTRTITLVSDTIISATFEEIIILPTFYTVTITPAVNGTITVKDGDETVTSGNELEENTVLTLTVAPAQGYKFEKWWDDNTELTRAITLVSDTTIEATFVQLPNYIVTIATPTNGTISVTHNGNTVNSGAELVEGSVLTLTATPDDDYEFGEWWDGNRTRVRNFTLIEPITIDATFVESVSFEETMIFYSTGSGLFQMTLADARTTGASPSSTRLTTAAYQALEWTNGVVYATTTTAFGTINQTTGEFTVINSAVGFHIISMAWNPENNTMYATTNNNRFGTIDLTTGAFTQIGADLSPHRVVIAIDNEGVCFAQEIGAIANPADARIGRIDLTTGVFTSIAIARLTIATIDLSIDRETNILYSPQLTGTNFTTINKTTGARTVVGAVPERFQAFTIIGKAETPAPITYTVTITAPANGTIIVKDGDDEVENGDEVEENTILTLTAIPEEGYEFGEWWDGNIELTRAITLVSDTAISATFIASSTSIVCKDAANRISAIVHPNPVTDILHIETENIIRQITVFDMQGRVVMTLYGDNKTVNLQMLPAGNFIVNIHTEIGVSPIRITKK